MNTINWGIIGCGDVTEIKSGPAFNKITNSKLMAVMRRNADKAADYARRHHVPKWYNDAAMLINDPEVNAIYVATPPSSHEQYAIAAMQAAKPVYLEKPMAINYETAANINSMSVNLDCKLVIAHYRRAWPKFIKLKELIDAKVIGEISLVQLALLKKKLTIEQLEEDKIAWRVNPQISGGGLFHDLAPHQLDILYFLFGNAEEVKGIATNQSGTYVADDVVSGTIQFVNDIVFTGVWNFASNQEQDICEIFGSNGKIRFSFFNPGGIEVITNSSSIEYKFDSLQHVQMPMIEKTVQYFLNKAPNPCSALEGAISMQWIDEIVRK